MLSVAVQLENRIYDLADSCYVHYSSTCPTLASIRVSEMCDYLEYIMVRRSYSRL